MATMVALTVLVSALSGHNAATCADTNMDPKPSATLKPSFFLVGICRWKSTLAG